MLSGRRRTRTSLLTAMPAAALAATVVALGGCSQSAASSPSGAGVPSSARPTAGLPVVRLDRVLATGLRVPWGVALLRDGSALVAERPTGRVVRVSTAGAVADVGTVPGVDPRGEGGLLGLAVLPGAPAQGGAAAATLVAYLTSTEGDNRLVTLPYLDGRLGDPVPILTGIPSAGRHNGGIVVVGPDGNLWIGTGDAGDTAHAQDLSSLGGKILHITPTGGIPTDNPFPRSPVWSYGHRNVQGLAFDSARRLWATEFGQDRWDELNLIQRGGDYGWPIVEGRSSRPGFVQPQVVWATDDASPSGLAIVDDVAYVGALRGQRLWQVPLLGGTAGEPRPLLTNRFGRLRSVVAAGPSSLWVTTSNRDGRGAPAADDDRVLRLSLG